MANKINNPHDKFFKSFIYKKENAIDFLKVFLPGKLVQNIDFSTLTIENTSFIPDSLNEIFSDAIFKCKLKEDEKEFFISILIEHKSYPDKYIAIQLLNYITNAYLEQLKSSDQFNLVIPFIYYHGKENWTYKPLSDIIDGLPDYLKGYAPSFDTIFIDLNRMSEGALQKINNIMLLSALYMQKFSFNEDILIARITDILSFGEKVDNNDWNFIRNIFVYFNELVEIDVASLKSIIEGLPQNTKKEIMTTYQKIKQEGRREGRQEGVKKGVINLFKNKFSIIQIAEIMELSTDQVTDILKRNQLI